MEYFCVYLSYGIIIATVIWMIAVIFFDVGLGNIDNDDDVRDIDDDNTNERIKQINETNTLCATALLSTMLLNKGSK